MGMESLGAGPNYTPADRAGQEKVRGSVPRQPTRRTFCLLLLADGRLMDAFPSDEGGGCTFSVPIAAIRSSWSRSRRARRLPAPHAGRAFVSRRSRARRPGMAACGCSAGSSSSTRGQGAFGTVFKAPDRDLDRVVAVKVPRAGNLAGAEEFDRFQREARSVAQLRHPSIVPVYEVGQHDGVPYLVSEFVQGVTLTDLLSARRPGVREAAELIAKVADALAFAHDHGVVHRDMKPSNIIVAEDGTPHVMDFGLAKRAGAASFSSRNWRKPATRSLRCSPPSRSRNIPDRPWRSIINLPARGRR
jgi:tRNA A-37 threonylcarbamoyl transferase component Bud32